MTSDIAQAGMPVSPLKAPFPWFGGKRRVSHEVWARFGDCPNYVEPFFGSGAVLLGRPHAPGVETVNDLDGFVANFWRAVSVDPIGVAEYADNPVNENDLHARHAWLVGERETLTRKLEGHPQYYDAKIAGWWVWGQCCWIGGGFCSGKGPWRVVDGRLVFTEQGDVGEGVHRKRINVGNVKGVNRKLPHVGDGGRGINRQLPHVGDGGRGINRQLPHLWFGGQGVHGGGVERRRICISRPGRGLNYKREFITEWMLGLKSRLRSVRVCCGEWSRVMSNTVTVHQGVTAVFLDPPYSAEAERDSELYARDDEQVAVAAAEWARKNQDNPKLRIAFCGYEGEHEFPGWTEFAWKAPGGYGNQGEGRGAANAHRERIWFSPHCLEAGGQLELEIA